MIQKKIGKSLYRVVEVVDEDWHYYSKAWHRAHGPKKTVTERYIKFFRNGKTKRVDIDRFAGNYVLNAYLNAYKLKVYNYKTKSLKRVQLNKHFQVKKNGCISGVTFYSRLLEREVYDYAAEKDGIIFHAGTKKEAVAGLRKKIENKITLQTEVITKQTGFDLGFCETGMSNFCDDNDLDIDGSYTREELQDIVNKNAKINSERYDEELKALKIRITR